MSARRLAALAALAAGLFGGACSRQEPAAAPAATGAAPANRPDVVLVTIDTWRADAAGFAGNARVATPLLDRLAATGRVYPDTHAHNVVTLPSHTNILTGLYPFQHGIRDNSGFKLDPAIPTMATLLHGAGYATGAFVAAFPLDRRYGLGSGFDDYDDKFKRGSDTAAFVLAERRGDEVVAAALAWWSAHADKPRLLWVHLYDPHAGYDPPEPFATRYRAMPYLGEVAATDSFLVPLLAPHLDGRERPALVVVTGDHGEALGDHGELTHGLFAYEATLKVPLVLWGSGVTPGRDERAARHIDILPTVLERVGVEPPRRLPGRSLLEPPAAVDSYFESLSTALNRGWAPLRGLLRDHHKFIELPLPELYDLGSDPAEANNLVAPRTQLATELRQALPRESTWPPERGATTSEEEARLRSLGYAVGSVPPKSTYGPEDDPKNLIGIDAMIHDVIDLYSRGRYVEAVAKGRELVARRPDLAEGYEHLSLALRQLERLDEAIAVLEEGKRKARARDSLDSQLGMALAEAGRPEEAVRVLTPLAPARDPDTLRTLGMALADAGHTDRAVEVLTTARELAPNDPEILTALGMAELHRDRAAEAARWLREALRLNDGLASAWNALGVALYSTEGPAAAVAAWQKAIALDPQLWDALYNVGLVANSLGDRATAKSALTRYVATAPPERFAAEIARARQILATLGG